MKILVLGGSYFLGRWFVQYAQKDHVVTVANRGNVPVNLPNVKQVVIDRSKVSSLDVLKTIEYDCIVDFCAYQAGDIQSVVERIGAVGKRYLFMSTVDVYRRGTGEILDETAELEYRHFPGPEGEYIAGKVALEKELAECCENIGMEYVSLRAPFLYGPANYAPREKMFFDWIRQAGQILIPSDSTGIFQMLYVGDAARFLLAVCEKKEVQKAYNLCNQNTCDYGQFVEALREAVEIPFSVQEIPISEIERRQIPMPFPLRREESEQYVGQWFDEILPEQTLLAEGLHRSFETC